MADPSPTVSDRLERAARAIDPEAWQEAPADAAPDFLAEQVVHRLNSIHEARAVLEQVAEYLASRPYTSAADAAAEFRRDFTLSSPEQGETDG